MGEERKRLIERVERVKKLNEEVKKVSKRIREEKAPKGS